MPYGLCWGAPWSEVEAAWGPPARQLDQTLDQRFSVVYEGLSENCSTVSLDFTADTGQLVQATSTAD
ncbi:hypothetical protein [Georgenia satyanarayanai]|uniref:hypothetical protein n=1 Tax=Georgenia satyanarayanai TaxID=860221 RepID=UPI0012646775|nr:hypothetical protein [Georgenia satyanarayanai]